MPKSIPEHSDQGLRNVIDNHWRAGKLHEPYYLEALEESARRKGRSLNLQVSLNIVKTAASERRFIPYRQLADASGADWAEVRYAVNTSRRPSRYAYGRRCACLVQSSLISKTSNLEGWNPTLKGFIAVCRTLGYVVEDEEAFLKDQQRRVFAWGEDERTP